MAASPDRAAIETPSGNIASGPVVDRRLQADASGCHWEVLVDVGPVGIWYPEADAGIPDPDTHE